MVYVAQQIIIVTFDTKMYLSIADEVSMISYNLALMMDENSRKVYDPNKTLCGKYVLFLGVFSRQNLQVLR